MKEKVCKKCNEIKNLDRFLSGRNVCKDCQNEQARQKYTFNKNRKKENSKKKKEEYNIKVGSKCCKSCSLTKDFSEFEYGRNKCIKCRGLENKVSRQKYYYNNIDKQKEIAHKKYEKNKEKIKQRNKTNRKNKKEQIKKYNKEYSKNNKDKIRLRGRNWATKKRKTDICYNIHLNVSRAVRAGIKNERGVKKGRCLDFLPFESWQVLKDHIDSLRESWMIWDNYGKYDSESWDDNDQSTWTWQIDHIIPKADLPYDSMEHPNFKKCWTLSNLRPYSAKQNVIDGANRTRHKKNKP